MNVPVILALGAIIVFAIVDHHDARARIRSSGPRCCYGTGAAIMAVFTVLAGIVIVGYALQDPGGTAALLMTLAWVVPMLILAVAAWFWPAPTAPLLLALVLGLHRGLRLAGLRPRGPAQLRQRQRTRHRRQRRRAGVPGRRARPETHRTGRLAARGFGRAAADDHAYRTVRPGWIAHRGQRGAPDRGNQLRRRRPDGPRQPGIREATGGRRLKTSRYPGRVTRIGPETNGR